MLYKKYNDRQMKLVKVTPSKEYRAKLLSRSKFCKGFLVF